MSCSTRGGDGDQTPADVLAAADARSHGYAFQVASAGGPSRLWLTDARADNARSAVAAPTGDETEPDWDLSAERLAFRRPGGEDGCQLCAVVPGVAGADAGVALPLVAPESGRTQHAPAWQGRDDKGLFYAVTNGCDPGTGCAGEVHYLRRPGDATSGEVVVPGLRGVVDLDVDPQDADRLLVVADGGAALYRVGEDPVELEDSGGTSAATYTPDGHRIFGISGDRSTLRVWDRNDQRLLDEPTIAELVEEYTARGGDAAGLEPQGAHALSVSPYVDDSGTHTNVAVLLDDDDTATPPVVAVVHIESEGTTASIASTEVVPFSITTEGQVVAAAQ